MNTAPRRAPSQSIHPAVRAPLAAAFVLLAAVFAAPEAGAKAGDHEKFHWSGALRAGQTLEVHGVNGSITAVPTTGSDVVVDAEKYGKRSDPDEVQIQVIEEKDLVVVCAVYPGAGNACEGHGHFHSHTRNNDVVVDFELRVPAGVRLIANTVNGEIEATGLRGPVQARTVNGNCTIETDGAGEAASVNGSVLATIGRPAAADRLEFSSVNGSITLRAPAGLDAEVEGSTVNGSIDSDFPVTVTGRWGPRSMHGVIGRGGARLHMTTVNGAITIERRHADS